MLLTEKQIGRLSGRIGYPVLYDKGFYFLNKDGQRLLLMPWHENMRLKNMRQKVRGRVIGPVSAMKSECVDQRCYPIEAVTARELDVCEWVLGEKITSVFALTDECRVMHLIGRFASGARCTLDLSCGLNEGTRETERHEVLAPDGNLCDLPVGMQFASEDIYAFSSDDPVPGTYMEVMIGDEFYTREEAQILRDAGAVLADEDEMKRRAVRLEELTAIVALAFRSSRERARMEVGL